MRPYFLAGLACLIAAPNVPADGCRRATYQPAYVAPTYAHHGYDYHQQIVLVPKAFQVVKALDSYASVGDEYRQAYFAQLVAQELAKIAETKRQLEQPAAPIPAAKTGPEPKIPQLDQVKADDAKTVKMMFENSCVKCHMPNTKRLDLTGDPSKLTYAQRGDILDRIMAPEHDAAFMPQNGKAVSGAELTAMWNFKRAAK
jgi:mono/diheme cytochrome c family protein